jgi:S1-C subfamily serine protease
MSNRIKLIVIILTFVVLLLAACGGSEETPTAEIKSDVPDTTSQDSDAPDVDAPGSGAAASVKDVRDAVIQIEAQGTFVDPEFGEQENTAGRGSGFIIDESGIAVTNNHVVTGAALLKVWVGGDEGQSYNARVLGVSECSDLAVIDIEGDGFAYLDWYEGPIEVGEAIYVAGFPLGDPEYSLTKGIISKANADGETNWASVDYVIEYDATTNPGNSGGPVVTEDGRVVAVHYSGNSSTRQAFGISRDEAKDIIETLQTGQNLDSIGVNGFAVSNDDGSVTGIWVSSVQSGSAVDNANIQGGDIITELENLVLATDGTLSDYCDIIRSHGPDDTLSVEVLRLSEDQVLEGQLNGQTLEVTFQAEGGETADTGEEQPVDDTGGGSEDLGEGVYVSTEFDEADDWSTFDIPETDNYATDLYNSLLYVSAPEDSHTVYVLHDYFIEETDVALGTMATKIGGPNTINISLVCRATEAGWYELGISGGGYGFAWKYVEGEGYTQLQDSSGRYEFPSTAINMKNKSNEIIAACVGDTLTLWVNDVEVVSVVDRTFRNGGQVGISVSTLGIPGAEVEFDWFAATEP